MPSLRSKLQPKLAPKPEQLAGLALALLLVGACAHARLVPLGTTWHHGRSAVAEAGDLTLVATPNSWHFNDEVAGASLPIHVTIVNEGKAAQRIRFEAFSLVDQAGKVYPAIPPMKLLHRLFASPRAPQAAPRPTYAALAGGGDGEPILAQAEPDDRVLPEGRVPPTERSSYWPGDYRRVLDLALRRGLLAPGGRTEGFLFFEPVRGATELALRFEPRAGTVLATRFSVEP